MTQPATEALEMFNQLAESIFRLAIEEDELDRKQAQEAQAMTQRHARERHALEGRKRHEQRKMWQFIDEHRQMLIERNKRSFATGTTIVQLKQHPLAWVVPDQDALLTFCRKHHFVKDVANPPSRQWRFSKAKLNTLMKARGEKGLRLLDAGLVDSVEGDESISLQPNEATRVYYSGSRLSPPSITFTRPSPE